MLDWKNISTVLLDMDGTILDLHFDNHFWLEFLPKRYSAHANISLTDAKQQLVNSYQKVAGTLSWYCLDYWQEETNLPITELKQEVAHLIQLRDDAKAFLTELKASGREVILVTNAHPESLSLKIERTQLDQYFDDLYSTHQFGVTKESQLLWQRLKEHHPFENKNTLFIDDSEVILKSAQTFGIKHLLGVANPDSKKAHQTLEGFEAVSDFRTLIEPLKAQPFLKC